MSLHQVSEGIVAGPTHTSSFKEGLNEALLRNNGLFINPSEACISDGGTFMGVG